MAGILPSCRRSVNKPVSGRCYLISSAEQMNGISISKSVLRNWNVPISIHLSIPFVADPPLYVDRNLLQVSTFALDSQATQLIAVNRDVDTTATNTATLGT